MRKKHRPRGTIRGLIDILKKAGCSENVIRHTIAVYGVACWLASRLYVKGVNVDFDLLQTASLLHDIGRAKTHGVEHGYVGAQILREMGMDERVALVVERHVGGGISREEAVKLGLPPRDYVPEALEEKVVCYADKLVASSGVVSFEQTLDEFKEELGLDHEAIGRLERLHREMRRLLEGEAIDLG
ncbi:MAG: TIGR00295 family protein [Candidatus Geothermarchaeales archaeon]